MRETLARSAGAEPMTIRCVFRAVVSQTRDDHQGRDAGEKLEHQADPEKMQAPRRDEKNWKRGRRLDPEPVLRAPEERGGDERHERSVAVEGIGPPPPPEPLEGGP